jgi:Flp pilus assembly pilin Flp
MLKKFWNDEMGAIVSAEIVLVATILVIGMVTGLASLRDAVIEELADVGAAIGALDQSYTVHGTLAHSASTAPMGFVDALDFCDGASTGPNSRCLTICGGAFATQVDGADGGTGSTGQ